MTGNYVTGSSTIVETTSSEVPDITTTVGLTIKTTANGPTTTSAAETTTASIIKTTATPTTTTVPLTTTTVPPAITVVVTGMSYYTIHPNGCMVEK